VQSGRQYGNRGVDRDIQESGRRRPHVLRDVYVLVDCADKCGKRGRDQCVACVEHALRPCPAHQAVAGKHAQTSNGRPDAWWKQKCRHHAWQSAEVHLLLGTDLDWEFLRQENGSKARGDEDPSPRM